MAAVKFCGLRRPEDVAFANETHPDFVGFVFAESRRRVTPEQAAALRENLLPDIRAVGVFVNEPLDSLCETAKRVRLDVVQLHGEESADDLANLRKRLPGTALWKAVRVRDLSDIHQAEGLPVDLLLLDGSVPGSGRPADWTLIRSASIRKPFFLAGGLCPENLAQALSLVHPFGIDLSSGIETDGCKDLSKMRAVMQAVQNHPYR